MLVAWRSGPGPHGHAPADNITDLISEGGTLIAVDPFGNETPLEPGDAGGFTLPLTETPTIVRGLDARVLLFRAALRFDPPVIAARAKRHDAELVLENTFGSTGTGTVKFRHPDSWRVQPEVIPVLLTPGETLRVPVSLTFGLNELAGPAPIRLVADLQAERPVPVFETPVRLDVGLDPLTVRLSYEPARPGPDGVSDDLVVYVVVENRGEAQSARLETYLRVPGYPTMQAPLTVPAGDTLRSTFTLEGGMSRAWGGTARFGVLEQDGTARLNMERTIE